MKSIQVISVVITLCFSEAVWSWGSVGHRTVGEIANTLLPKASRDRVLDVLDNETITDVSNWADAIKVFPEWDHAKYYHFEKIHDNTTYVPNLVNMSAADRALGGTTMALLEAERVFLASNSSPESKKIALKFIIHLVGDIHQPLHTGRVQDNGGNKIPKTWNGAKTNLHAVWDYYIIAEAHGDMFSHAPAGQDEKEYAPYLIEKFKNYQAPKDSYEDINLWLNESMSYRPDAYKYKDENEAAYTKRFIDVIDSRIFLGGVRLAYLLNRLVKNEKPPLVKVNFLKEIEKIVGSLAKIVHFDGGHSGAGDIPQGL